MEVVDLRSKVEALSQELALQRERNDGSMERLHLAEISLDEERSRADRLQREVDKLTEELMQYRSTARSSQFAAYVNAQAENQKLQSEVCCVWVLLPCCASQPMCVCV